MMKGLVFDIQRFSLQDGPGIRTTVFLKGCPLNCQWCHNPESISSNPELGYIETKCVFCAACQLICPEAAITVDQVSKKWNLDREKCTVCGQCVNVCFTEALTIAGKEMDINEIISDVLKDEAYYKQSSGGMTVSGGEPMHQFDFLLELLKTAKSNHIHTAIETSGIAPQKNYEIIFPYVDVFLFDYKATGVEEHKKLTGVNNKLILDNLDFLYRQKASIEIRCPMVPEINDSAVHMQAIADLENKYPDLSAIRILPYHNVGNSKYIRYHIDNSLTNLQTTTEEQKAEWRAFFESKGCKKVVVE